MRERVADITDLKPIPRSPWINVTAAQFQNGWRNVGSGFAFAGYYKDATGLVHIRGRITAGTASTVVFALPIGYRPDASLMLPAAGYAGGAAAASLTIDTNGNVSTLGTAPDIGFYATFLAAVN